MSDKTNRVKGGEAKRHADERQEQIKRTLLRSRGRPMINKMETIGMRSRSSRSYETTNKAWMAGKAVMHGSRQKERNVGVTSSEEPLPDIP